MLSISYQLYYQLIADNFQEDRKKKNDTSLQVAAGQLEPVGKIQMKTRRQLRGGWTLVKIWIFSRIEIFSPFRSFGKNLRHALGKRQQELGLGLAGREADSLGQLLHQQGEWGGGQEAGGSFDCVQVHAIPLRSSWVMTCAYAPSGTYVACG